MDTRLCDGDFAKGENGLPETVEGMEELLQRAQIRLCIPKGAFVHDPSLGSRLAQLQPAPAEAAACLRSIPRSWACMSRYLSVAV